MYAIVQNNQIIKTGELRQLFPKISFPRTGVDSSFLAANGVKEIVDGERKDERFYWVTPANPAIQVVNGIPTQVYTNTAKLLEDREEEDEEGNPLYVKVYDPTANDGEGGMVDSEERLVTKGLKSQWISQTKETANSLLKPTDWMVIRKAERDIAIPTATANYRANVIQAAETIETAITNAADIEAFISVITAQQWPDK